jgi:thiamine biosynthesis protein ThiC
MKRTIFTVRDVRSRVSVDSRFTYDKAEEVVQAVVAEKVAARLTNSAADFSEAMQKWPDSARACRYYATWALRMRLNNDIFGTFNVISEHEPSDDELIAWYTTQQEKKKCK